VAVEPIGMEVINSVILSYLEDGEPHNHENWPILIRSMKSSLTSVLDDAIPLGYNERCRTVRSKLKRPLFVAHDMSGFKS